MPVQKILIVDDEIGLSESISLDLQTAGRFNVEKAKNGQDGLEKYKQFLPDLVIMDIEMPIMDGYQSSHNIKAFDPAAKILVLTGNPKGSRAKRTVKDGIALNLLQKPIRLRDLRQIILDILPSYT
ncbi:response regulator [Thermodesulfobacteriota bacterium]